MPRLSFLGVSILSTRTRTLTAQYQCMGTIRHGAIDLSSSRAKLGWWWGDKHGIGWMQALGLHHESGVACQNCRELSFGELCAYHVYIMQLYSSGPLLCFVAVCIVQASHSRHWPIHPVTPLSASFVLDPTS
ncbi:hypothetical protein QBC35DRAFT_507155 [Podospora australis]|uniref:Uncharacterized protein n=1 Tax=Podospora australis TaxID=1536484 RepID=A0AAN6WKY1_9PEZI|nr:hypothetical protein QBC35DRAFT_507155 [Podospora australis]